MVAPAVIVAIKSVNATVSAWKNRLAGDKTAGLIRQITVRGLPKVNDVFMMTMIGWNLTRMRSVYG